MYSLRKAVGASRERPTDRSNTVYGWSASPPCTQAWAVRRGGLSECRLRAAPRTAGRARTAAGGAGPGRRQRPTAGGVGVLHARQPAGQGQRLAGALFATAWKWSSWLWIFGGVS